MWEVRASAHSKTKFGCVFKTEDIAKVAKLLPLESEKRGAITKPLRTTLRTPISNYRVSLGGLAGIVPRNNLSQASKKADKLCKSLKLCVQLKKLILHWRLEISFRAGLCAG